MAQGVSGPVAGDQKSERERDREREQRRLELRSALQESRQEAPLRRVVPEATLPVGRHLTPGERAEMREQLRRQQNDNKKSQP